MNSSADSHSVIIPERYLDEGTLFLAQVPNGPLSSCAYGLRIKVGLINDYIYMYQRDAFGNAF